MFYKKFCRTIIRLIFTALKKGREFSSAGSEHLPYKQRVGGSNPSTPTKPRLISGFYIWKNVLVAQLVEQLTLNQRVQSSSLCGDTLADICEKSSFFSFSISLKALPTLHISETTSFVRIVRYSFPSKINFPGNIELMIFR